MKRVKGGSEGGEGFNDVLLRRDALDATCMKYRCCFFLLVCTSQKYKVY